jgi:hypothetical protein
VERVVAFGVRSCPLQVEGVADRLAEVTSGGMLGERDPGGGRQRDEIQHPQFFDEFHVVLTESDAITSGQP